MVVLSACFVLKDLAVNLVNEEVDGRIKIVFGGLAVDVLSANVEREFRSVLEWLERQDHLCVDHVIKVPHDARHLCMNVFPDSWGDVKMVTSNVQVHCVLSIKGIYLCS